MTTTGRTIASLLSLVGVAGALAACGGSSSGDSGTTDADAVQRAARGPGAGDARGLHQGDRHRGRVPQRRATPSWPTRSSRRATRHRPTSSSPRTSPAMTWSPTPGLFAPLDEAPCAGAASSTGRRRGTGSASPPARPCWPTTRRWSPEARAAGVDHGPGRTRSGRARSASPPGGADFQAIVSAVLALEGEDATRSVAEGARRPTPRSTEQHRGHAGRRRRARSRPGSSTTTTGTRTRPSPAPTARTCSWTSSATRTRARSSASPAPACSSLQRARRGRAAAGRLPDRPSRASRRWPTATRWSTPVGNGVAVDPDAHAAGRARRRRRSTSARSTARRWSSS